MEAGICGLRFSEFPHGVIDRSAAEQCHKLLENVIADGNAGGGSANAEGGPKVVGKTVGPAKNGCVVIDLRRWEPPTTVLGGEFPRPPRERLLSGRRGKIVDAGRCDFVMVGGVR